MARLPVDVEVRVLAGQFAEVITAAPPADINIFGMPTEPDLAAVRRVFAAVQTSVLFLRDSAHESVMV